MSRFRKLSQTIWHCQYHIVWTPKYRYRILEDKIADLVRYCIRAYCEQLKFEVVELNVQVDHVHLISMVPPKISISDYPGSIKGRTSIRVLNRICRNVFDLGLTPVQTCQKSTEGNCAGRSTNSRKGDGFMNENAKIL